MSMNAVATVRTLSTYDAGAATVLPRARAANGSEGPGHAQESASASHAEDGELRRVFDAFVGETFFSQMLAAMRKTLGEPPYMHGGHAERVFQGQLDQLLSERLANATAGQLSGKMFELFQLQRPGA